MLAADFFTTEVWTSKGLTRYLAKQPPVQIQVSQRVAGSILGPDSRKLLRETGSTAHWCVKAAFIREEHRAKKNFHSIGKTRVNRIGRGGRLV